MFGISWVVSDPVVQHHGYATSLLCRIHREHKGVFITKTNSAEEFYLRNGYKEVFFDGVDSVLVFVNDKQGVDF